MSKPRVVLLPSQDGKLREFLESDPENRERAAAVLFKRFHREQGSLPESDRYVATEVIPFQNEWITSSSPSHIAFELKYLRELFRRCEEESLVFGFVHNHPGDYADFSDMDDQNERTLLEALCHRNGHDIHFVALLWSNKEWKARIRHGIDPQVAIGARHVLVLDNPFQIYGLGRDTEATEDIWARQMAAFGQPFTNKLQSLRVAVIGSGGTGSATIALLARAGIGELIIIDNDKIERSNLNRVRGAGIDDVGKSKVGVIKAFVERLKLPTKVEALNALIDASPDAIDALATCDVLFGCTDDHIGRELLNTAAYVYGQAYIDVGLGGEISHDKTGQPFLRYHYGRVSTILPEWGECLWCQGVISDTGVRREYAIRQNPTLTDEEAAERYLIGGGEQAPGVGPFTGAVADYAVATLFDLIRSFRRFPPELRRDFFKIDFVKMEISSNQRKDDQTCTYCGTRHYLLARERYRMNRPALGKRNEAI